MLCQFGKLILRKLIGVLLLLKKKEFEKFYKENKNIKKPSCVSTFEDDDNYYIIDMSRWSDQEKRYFIESRKELYYSN